MKTITIFMNIQGFERKSTLNLYENVIDSNGEVKTVNQFTDGEYDVVAVNVLSGNQTFADSKTLTARVRNRPAFSLSSD